MINTKKVTDRRQLRFESLDDILRDAESLVAAERTGRLRATGNWTLGQALGHLAFWIDAPFDGYPEMKTPPWFMLKLIRLFKNGFLNNKLPAGVRLPNVEAGTFGVDELPADEGYAALQASLDRLRSQTPTTPNPVLGEMSREEWIKINLRHAELHLSFFHVD